LEKRRAIAMAADAMRIPDYIAFGVLFVLIIWAVAAYYLGWCARSGRRLCCQFNATQFDAALPGTDPRPINSWIVSYAMTTLLASSSVSGLLRLATIHSPAGSSHARKDSFGNLSASSSFIAHAPI
jgi:hypothetical protein